MKRIAAPIAILALLLWSVQAFAAAPRAWLDRDSIHLGETVTLNIEVEGLNPSEPDFSVLGDEFQRLGVSSRTQMSLVNGQQSASTLWAVALEPRVEGVLSLPAIPVGAQATSVLRLTVLPAVAAAAGEDVFLEVEATPTDPYVQQQVRYRVRLFYAVTLLEGQLDEPAIAGVELRRLGNDLSYQTQLAGRRYNVVERRFALIPESSGELVLPPVRFRGRVLGGGGRFAPGLSGGRQVSASSEPIRIEVRSMPVGLAQPWLPAAQIELSATGDDWPEEVAVGEPLALELRLLARGVDAARLPELELPGLAGVEIYPDQPVLRTGEDGEWVQGERRQRFALVPQAPGDYVLPEIRLPWWNTDADRPEIAVLPARRLRVVPAGDAVAMPAASGSAGAAEATPLASARVWPWQALSALLLAAWCVTLALWWRQRRPAAVAARPAPPSRAALRATLLRRDPQAFERELLKLASASERPFTNLGALLPALAEPAQREALEAYRTARWRGGELDWAVLERVLRDGPSLLDAQDAARPEPVLPPHYPDHRDG